MGSQMTGYPELIALIKANPAWASLSDADCATAVVAVPVPAPTQMVFGSFRTLAAILPQQDYNVLRGALTAAATAEAAAGGSYINDAIAMLRLPGDQQGNGGGLNFGDPGFVSNLTTLCAQANLPKVVREAAHGLITITKRDEAVAYVLSRERMEAIIETLEIMGNPKAMKALKDAREGKTKYYPLESLDED